MSWKTRQKTMNNQESLVLYTNVLGRILGRDKASLDVSTNLGNNLGWIQGWGRTLASGAAARACRQQLCGQLVWLRRAAGGGHPSAGAHAHGLSLDGWLDSGLDRGLDSAATAAAVYRLLWPPVSGSRGSAPGLAGQGLVTPPG